MELAVSSNVCLAVLNLLGSICLEYVNRFLFQVSRSKILHCFLLHAIASTEREWIVLAPPISVDGSFFENSLLLCYVDFDIVCGSPVPSVGSVLCSFGIGLCFAALTTKEAIHYILYCVVFGKGRGVSVLVIKSGPSYCNSAVFIEACASEEVIFSILC